MPQKLGIVGMGLMGQAFIHNLSQSQFSLQGFDIDADRMKELRDQGGHPVDTPAKVAQGVNFVDSLGKLSKNKRYESIICCALSRGDRSDEDLVSQALLLLQESSFKYFEKARTINFKQFAITYIRENIKGYKSKQYHTNGSDLNELIHSAIKTIKNCYKRQVENLTFHEAKHLADHFNLDKTKGVKKIFELEAIQFGDLSVWRKNEKGDKYFIFDDAKNDIGSANYLPSNSVKNSVRSVKLLPQISKPVLCCFSNTIRCPDRSVFPVINFFQNFCHTFLNWN